MDNELPEENFSDDPDEQLRIENEILKLKIQAELGGDFEGEEDLPPDVENMFLKNVLEFERKQAAAPVKSLFEILENPFYIKENELNDDEVEQALSSLESLMLSKGITVDYAAEYDARTKYRFITEELFSKEAPVIDMPGMTMHYIYEEYHPNHAVDIENLANIFFKKWINRQFDENSLELAPEFTREDGSTATKEEILRKMQFLFDSYERFENGSISIDTVFYDLDEGTPGSTGFGFAGGKLSYDAVMETGEVQRYEDDFRLHLQYESYWSVFSLFWPGFTW